jgi:hypothetical protein
MWKLSMGSALPVKFLRLPMPRKVASLRRRANTQQGESVHLVFRSVRKASLQQLQPHKRAHEKSLVWPHRLRWSAAIARVLEFWRRRGSYGA